MDTWGISSGAFLVLYVALLAGVGGLVYGLRRHAVREHDELRPEPSLRACDVAMLNEGPKLALATAAAGLRDAGALAVDGDGGLVASGPRPSGAQPLERWLYGQVADHDRFRVWQLRREPVLAEMREHLRELALVPTRGQLAFVRLQALWFVPVAALGVARFDAGSANGKPVGFIGMLMLVAAGLAIACAVGAPARTERGDRVLEALRADDHEATPAAPAGALALSGATSLWAADAGLAAAIGLPRESGGGGWFGGDGGGCGGGGCGGGCGGGG
jgi:uncharacterized protein (TIGR04222 family)